MERKIQLAENAYLTAENGVLVLYKNGEKAGTVFLGAEEVYITLKGEKPKSREEAERRVGKDVLKLTWKDTLRYAAELGVVRRVSRESYRDAISTVAAGVFEDVLDSADVFSNRLLIRLTGHEWKAVEDLFYFDADCEGPLTREPLKVVERLAKASERFALVVKALAANPFLRQTLPVRSFLEKYWLSRKIVDTYTFGDGYGNPAEFAKKHGFSYSLTPIRESLSISGYNMGTLEAEEKGNRVYLEFTCALPPDSWYGVAVVAEDVKPSQYSALVELAEHLKHVRKGAERFDVLGLEEVMNNE